MAVRGGRIVAVQIEELHFSSPLPAGIPEGGSARPGDNALVERQVFALPCRDLYFPAITAQALLRFLVCLPGPFIIRAGRPRSQRS